MGRHIFSIRDIKLSWDQARHQITIHKANSSDHMCTSICFSFSFNCQKLSFVPKHLQTLTQKTKLWSLPGCPRSFLWYSFSLLQTTNTEQKYRPESFLVYFIASNNANNACSFAAPALHCFNRYFVFLWKCCFEEICICICIFVNTILRGECSSATL